MDVSESPYPPAAVGLRIYASWGRRLVAWLIDGAIVWLAYLLPPRLVGSSPVSIYLLWSASFPALYFVLLHGGKRGQTLGKRSVGIAVRDASSLGRLGYGPALGRFVVTGIFWLLLAVPGILDGFSPLWDENRRSWHDRAARSVVIRI